MPDTDVERLGLREGDQLLLVNGTDFENIEHAEAVRVLKANTAVTMHVRYFPYGYRKTYERVGVILDCNNPTNTVIYGTTAESSRDVSNYDRSANPDVKMSNSLYSTAISCQGLKKTNDLYCTSSEFERKSHTSHKGTATVPKSTIRNPPPHPKVDGSYYGSPSQCDPQTYACENSVSSKVINEPQYSTSTTSAIDRNTKMRYDNHSGSDLYSNTSQYSSATVVDQTARNIGTERPFQNTGENRGFHADDNSISSNSIAADALYGTSSLSFEGRIPSQNNRFVDASQYVKTSIPDVIAETGSRIY